MEDLNVKKNIFTFTLETILKKRHEKKIYSSHLLTTGITTGSNRD